jgi:hypothetical protein
VSADRSFHAIVGDDLDLARWQGLVHGEIGVLRLPGFLSADRCAAIMARLYADPRFAAYDPMDECGGVDPVAHAQIQQDLLAGSDPDHPPVSRRLGRTLYEYVVRGTAANYFKQVDGFDAARREICGPDGDVVDDVLALIGRIAGTTASVAHEPGYGRCYAGVIREVHGRSRLHTDDAREETPGFLVGQLRYQIGLYVILDMPECGGDMIVYDRESREDDRPFRQGYGLDPCAVAGNTYVGTSPRPGDLILFPDRNIHCVSAGAGAGKRIKLQAHLGVDGDGAVVCWS